jgi:hypothetical protein
MSAGEHLGNYLEEQTGRAPTQMNVFKLPKGGSESWTGGFARPFFCLHVYLPVLVAKLVD